MNKCLFVFIFILIAFSCNEKKKEALKNIDTLYDNLNGKVEETNNIDYKVDSTGKIGEQDSCCIVTTKYDEKGYQTKNIFSNKVGTEKTKVEYVHYENGAVKAINTTKNDKPLSKIKLDIDKDGKYIFAKSFDSGDKMDSYYTNIVSNEYGQLTSFKQFKPDSTLKMNMTNTYNRQYLMNNTIKDSTGKETYSYTVKRDDKNCVSEAESVSIEKDSTSRKVTKYHYDSFDEKYNWTQQTELDENGKPVKIIKRSITYYK